MCLDTVLTPSGIMKNLMKPCQSGGLDENSSTYGRNTWLTNVSEPTRATWVGSKDLLQPDCYMPASWPLTKLPWLDEDFESLCYRTFVFWQPNRSEWPAHRPDRRCKWLCVHNRPIWLPNGLPVDHKCWPRSAGRATCRCLMRVKCDLAAPAELFSVAAK